MWQLPPERGMRCPRCRSQPAYGMDQGFKPPSKALITSLGNKGHKGFETSQGAHCGPTG